MQAYMAVSMQQQQQHLFGLGLALPRATIRSVAAGCAAVHNHPIPVATYCVRWLLVQGVHTQHHE
jgi:hypothetical protein